jgi:hypothetical protein
VFELVAVALGYKGEPLCPLRAHSPCDASSEVSSPAPEAPEVVGLTQPGELLPITA